MVTVSKIPFPDPSWINNNETWAAEQLAVYLQNRTGEHSGKQISGSLQANGRPDKLIPFQRSNDYPQLRRLERCVSAIAKRD